MLDDKMAVIFHSYVMRVAYLTKRVKPQLSVPISYLSTQVTKPNMEDLHKLNRVMCYIKDNVGDGITLSTVIHNKCVKVVTFIDASYGCHDDGKSHTGVYVTLGTGPVFVRSVKQKIVTKSSTEAELVALSDEAGVMFHIEEYLVEQGYKCEMVVGQDKKARLICLLKRREIR